MELNQTVRIGLRPTAVRHTGDRREIRWQRDFAARVNGKTGVIVGIHANLLKPISVNVEGHGIAQFNATELEVLA
jgi:hypothetical protein